MESVGIEARDICKQQLEKSMKSFKRAESLSQWLYKICPFTDEGQKAFNERLVEVETSMNSAVQFALNIETVIETIKTLPLYYADVIRIAQIEDFIEGHMVELERFYGGLNTEARQIEALSATFGVNLEASLYAAKHRIAMYQRLKKIFRRLKEYVKYQSAAFMKNARYHEVDIRVTNHAAARYFQRSVLPKVHMDDISTMEIVERWMEWGTFCKWATRKIFTDRLYKEINAAFHGVEIFDGGEYSVPLPVSDTEIAVVAKSSTGHYTVVTYYHDDEGRVNELTQI